MLSSVGRCVLMRFGISFALSSLCWCQNPTDKITIAKNLSALSVLSYLLLHFYCYFTCMKFVIKSFYTEKRL